MRQKLGEATGLLLNVFGKSRRRKFSCIVDTGACESVLNSKFLRFFKIRERLPKVILRSFSQHTVSTILRAKVEIYIEGVGLTLQTVSFVNIDLKYGLFGLPFLKEIEGSIINKNNKFFLGIPKKTIDMKLIKNIEIQPNSTLAKEVEIQLNDLESYVPEALNPQTQSYLYCENDNRITRDG